MRDKVGGIGSYQAAATGVSAKLAVTSSAREKYYASRGGKEMGDGDVDPSEGNDFMCIRTEELD